MLNTLRQDLEPHIIKRKFVEEKQRLICQGSHNEGPYILQSGWLMLTRLDDTGKRQVLKLVLPGEVFGFQPDIHGLAIYSAVTLTHCAICIIPSAFQLCSTHPELAMRLAWVSASDLLLLELYLEKISQHRATERVAFMVLELFRRLKQRNMNNGNTFQFPLRQEDIGDFLGLTNVHVNRTLHTLKEKGLFSISHHILTIHNYDALSNLVGKELKMYFACEVSP